VTGAPAESVHRQEASVDVNYGYVSRAWLAGIPFAGWALIAALAGDRAFPIHPGFFLFLAMIVLLMCAHGWAISRPDLTTADLRRQMRLIAVLLAGLSLASAAALLILGHTGTAALTAACGLLLGAVCWPSGWALRRRDKDLNRPYKGEFVALPLAAAIIATCGAAFMALDLAYLSPRQNGANDLSSLALMLALATSSFIQAWDERRRPKPTAAPMPPPSRQPR
jgi:hypothetical protein